MFLKLLFQLKIGFQKFSKKKLAYLRYFFFFVIYFSGESYKLVMI